jgi:DNA-binding HxlR family transcriptional regulator
MRTITWYPRDMQEGHRYGHFCPLARALELVGERWGLLVVRDLLAGDRRFTDLLRSCAGVTPRQLAARLRQLEAAGIVEREQTPGRREAWYRLTPAGRELRGAAEALLLWGVRHAVRPPVEEEPVRADHVLNGTRLALNAAAPVPAPVCWVWRFPGEPYTLRFDGHRWHLSPGPAADADVVVETTPRAWAELVSTPRGARRADDAPRLHGRPGRVRAFAKAFGLAPAAQGGQAYPAAPAQEGRRGDGTGRSTSR